MTDRVQPGTEVDSRLWQEFRNVIKERKGGIRGHLRKELETALRLYINDESEVSGVQVNRRLARIEAELGVAGTDGGADTIEQPEHTHAPSETKVTEKPAANSPTDKKVAYLTHRIRKEAGIPDGTPETMPRKVIVNVVKDEYGFRSDTAKRYVEQLIDGLGLQDHPDESYNLLVSQDKYERILQERREQVEENANKELGL